MRGLVRYKNGARVLTLTSFLVYFPLFNDALLEVLTVVQTKRPEEPAFSEYGGP